MFTLLPLFENLIYVALSTAACEMSCSKLWREASNAISSMKVASTHAAVARPSVNARRARLCTNAPLSPLVIRSFRRRDGHHPRVYAEEAVGETGADTCVQSFSPPLAVCLDDPRVDGLEVCCSGV